MAKRGRKVKYTEDTVSDLLEKLAEYIKKTDIPILAEFAYQNNITRQRLYEFPELSDTIKKLHDKKEAQLERLGLKGSLNSTMTVFSLKQLGWKDKQEEKSEDNTDKTIEFFKRLADAIHTKTD